MSLDEHFLRVLGDKLRELTPLIAEAMRALDRPGSRSLRRKLDGTFRRRNRWLGSGCAP